MMQKVLFKLALENYEGTGEPSSTESEFLRGWSGIYVVLLRDEGASLLSVNIFGEGEEVIFSQGIA